MSRREREPARPLFPVKPNMRRSRHRGGNWDGYFRFYRLGEGLLCHYCTWQQATTRDHVVPLAMGGSSAPTNVVPACLDCNSIKGAAFPTCLCKFCERARFIWANEQAEQQ